MRKWDPIDRAFDVVAPVIEWILAAWLVVAVVVALAITGILVIPVWIVAGFDKGVQMLMRGPRNGR